MVPSENFVAKFLLFLNFRIQALLKLMAKEKIDLGLLTFVCCSEINEQNFMRTCSPFFSLLLDYRPQVLDLFVSFRRFFSF